MNTATRKNVDTIAMQREQGPLLEVKNLQVDFTTDSKKAVHAVRDASFNVYPGQWVAIVRRIWFWKVYFCNGGSWFTPWNRSRYWWFY